MATLLGCPHMVITLYVYILGNTLLCPLLVEYQSDWFGVSLCPGDFFEEPVNKYHKL